MSTAEDSVRDAEGAIGATGAIGTPEGSEHTKLRYSIVIPTVGRPSLGALIDSLDRSPGPLPDQVVVVDDRPSAESTPLRVPPVRGLDPVVVRCSGRGPAAARNVGWRSCRSEWVAFLDDDVQVAPDWTELLAADLAACAADVAGSQGRIRVPRPQHRRPTDWERNTAGLMTAAWATADMAYRRSALVQVGGFDERFPRAYREDADLALRVREAGWTLEPGGRSVVHPVRPADRWASARVQAGNADDALMRALHGPHWRMKADVPRGRLRGHLAVTGAAAAAALAAFVRRPRLAGILGMGTAALAAEFTWRRIRPGPLPGEEGWLDEWGRMVATSAVIPPLAVWHRLRGTFRARGVEPWPPPVRAVLFDRDGTLVRDVPYNGDPRLVELQPGAAEVIRHLRRAGVGIGVVSNQSGVGRGLLTREHVDAVNRRIEQMLGPFDTWQVCPHGPDDGCACRKPLPELILRAARRLGIPPHECGVIGDIGADVAAATAAGARPVLVPTDVTRAEEIADAPLVAANLTEAVQLLLAPDGNSGRAAAVARVPR